MIKASCLLQKATAFVTACTMLHTTGFRGILAEAVDTLNPKPSARVSGLGDFNRAQRTATTARSWSSW